LIFVQESICLIESILITIAISILLIHIYASWRLARFFSLFCILDYVAYPLDFDDFLLRCP